MDTDVRRWPRLGALAILVALTVALAHSVQVQRVSSAARLPVDEMQHRQACRERLVRAIDEARAAGDVELADWIEALPVYNCEIPRDAPAAHPAARPD